MMAFNAGITVHKSGKVEGAGSDEYGSFKFEIQITDSKFSGWKSYDNRNGDKIYWKGNCSFAHDSKHSVFKLSKFEGHWGWSEGGEDGTISFTVDKVVQEKQVHHKQTRYSNYSSHINRFFRCQSA